MPSRRVELAELAREYLTCRVRRHTWEDIPDDGGTRRSWEASRTVVRLLQRCTRCATLRYEAWNPITGDQLFVDYRYPEGYSMATFADDRGATNKGLRKEYLSRLAEVPAEPIPIRRRRNRSA